jgi:hypothetical protein
MSRIPEPVTLILFLLESLYLSCLSLKLGKMTPKYLMFAVALVAVTSVAVVAMELAVLSQIQQDADAQSSTGQCARALKNASAQFCHNLGNAEEESAAEEPEEANDEEEDDE